MSPPSSLTADGLAGLWLHAEGRDQVLAEHPGGADDQPAAHRSGTAVGWGMARGYLTPAGMSGTATPYPFRRTGSREVDSAAAWEPAGRNRDLPTG